MKKIIPFFIMICCLLAVSSCSYDNFEEPKATLTGRAIYDGEAVEVQSLLYSRMVMLCMALFRCMLRRTEAIPCPFSMVIINWCVWAMLLGKDLLMTQFILQ